MQTTSSLHGTFWKVSHWRYLKCSNVIGQSNCLLSILGVSLAGIRRRFVLILPNTDPWNKSVANTFSRSHECRSISPCLRLIMLANWTITGLVITPLNKTIDNNPGQKELQLSHFSKFYIITWKDGWLYSLPPPHRTWCCWGRIPNKPFSKGEGWGGGGDRGSGNVKISFMQKNEVRTKKFVQ